MASPASPSGAGPESVRRTALLMNVITTKINKKQSQIRNKGSNEPSINLAVCLVRAMSRKVTYTEENEQLDRAQNQNLRTKRFIAKSDEGKQSSRGHRFYPPSSAYIGGQKEQFQR